MPDTPLADPALPELPAGAFERIDDSSDAEFYARPRLVSHIDDAAIAALTEFYRGLLPAGGVILDLMSSWVSHLPPEVAYGEVIGHGMNVEELAANSRFKWFFGQDFNQRPDLPLATASVDAAVMCVSVQYLRRPTAVFAEAARVLRPAAPIIVSFSNRCFPTKAVAIWRSLDGDGHARLVELYLRRAGFARTEVHVLADGRTGDPLTAVVGWTSPVRLATGN